MFTQELWRRLQEETAHLGYEMTGGSLYLDPDIIDLTLIPPPITPEKASLISFKLLPLSNKLANVEINVILLSLLIHLLGLFIR